MKTGITGFHCNKTKTKFTISYLLVIAAKPPVVLLAVVAIYTLDMKSNQDMRV